MNQATLIRNLKLFNAKERDHLMRAAYLGFGERYEEATTFLSKGFDNKLKPHAIDLGLDNSEELKCVFAGMDYHLDWLFAALWMTVKHPEWDGKPDEKFEVPLEIHKRVGETNNLYSDFRPITATQEDIDLLVVYTDGEKLAILFIEAKGSAPFDRVQLGRKLIRLHRIISHDEIRREAKFNDLPTRCRLILAAPTERDLGVKKARKFEDWISFAKALPEKRADEFSAMKKALCDIEGDMGTVHFLPLTEFPETLKVTRKPKKSSTNKGEYTHWTLEQR